MKKLEALIDKLNEADIRVDNYEEDGVLLGYELNTYTDGGVNQILFLDFRDSKLDPTDADDFLTVYNDLINDIDIDNEIESNRQDPSYKNAFTLTQAVDDFTAWKEKLETIFKNPKDSLGGELEIGQTVLTDDPIDDDLYQHAFAGQVTGFRGVYVTVVDGEGEHFDIEPNRVTIQED